MTINSRARFPAAVSDMHGSVTFSLIESQCRASRGREDSALLLPSIYFGLPLEKCLLGLSILN
jgi:hypothetical protein